MAISNPICGLILLGNSGVGKSFLANRLLNEDIFESTYSVRSVTRHTEWRHTTFYNKMYMVQNIPGLIEANQALVDQNRHEIMKAFLNSPYAIVMFIFGQQGGRLRDEDIVAFQKLHEAYVFQSESLLLFINGVPEDPPDDYEIKTRRFLSQLVAVPVYEDHILFFKRADTSNDYEKIHEALVHAIIKCTPTVYEKKRDIELEVEQITRLKRESKERQEAILGMKHHHAKCSPATSSQHAASASQAGVYSEEFTSYVRKLKTESDERKANMIAFEQQLNERRLLESAQSKAKLAKEHEALNDRVEQLKADGEAKLAQGLENYQYQCATDLQAQMNMTHYHTNLPPNGQDFDPHIQRIRKETQQTTWASQNNAKGSGASVEFTNQTLFSSSTATLDDAHHMTIAKGERNFLQRAKDIMTKTFK